MSKRNDDGFLALLLVFFLLPLLMLDNPYGRALEGKSPINWLTVARIVVFVTLSALIFWGFMNGNRRMWEICIPILTGFVGLWIGRAVGD